MTITLSEFRASFRRRAQDTDATQYRWSSELVDDAINDGLRALGDYNGVVAQHTFTSVADDTSIFTLPDGFLRLLSPPLKVGTTDEDTLSWSDAEYSEETYPAPGDAQYDADDASAPKGHRIVGNTLVKPDGLDEGETLTIYYEALWPEVKADTDALDLPYWAEIALLHYCHYYCLMQEGTLFSTQGFWKTQIESGKPTDNPAFEGCDWFLKQFESICQKHIRQVV